MSTKSVQLDRSIRKLLAALRRRIRCYVWAQGLTALVAALGVVFWISLAVDWFFEPSLFVRKILLAAAAFTLAGVAYRIFGRRALVPLPDHSMAALLERRFSQFDDGLLTAVELTTRPPDPNDCNRAMLEATCRSAAEPIAQIRLRDVFNARPLHMAILAAVLFVAATGSFRSLAPEAFGVWMRRSLLMSDELWPRRTILSVEGFPDGVACVARGSDFTVIAKADTTARHVPHSVRISYRPQGSSRLDATMIREGQPFAGRDSYQEYSYTFRSLLSPIELDLRGGDASIRNLRIEVVDAPALVRLDAECHYPKYMGKGSRVLPAAGVVPIPRGTAVTVVAEANKRLVRVQIDDGDSVQVVADSQIRRLQGILAGQRKLTRSGWVGGRLKESVAEQRALAEQLNEAGHALRRRFADEGPSATTNRLLEDLAAITDEMLELADGNPTSDTEATGPVADRLSVAIDSLGRLLSFPRFNYRLQPIDATKTLELTLHDTDGIKSTVPIRITLSAVDDQPPQPIVQLRGISSAITPQARLPFTGLVRDDYGVDRIWLEYAVEGREPRKKTLRQLDDIVTHVPIDDDFDVDALRLEPGQKILVAVKARDRYDLALEPNEGSGDRWILDVVTPERLRAILEAREIVLRQRFETIVEDVEEIRETLAALTFDKESTDVAAAQPEPGEMARQDSAERRRGVRLLRIQRARQNAQKDSHETAGVSDAFADIRRELVNNRIYTVELRIRIEQDIVTPLSSLVEADFVQLDEQLARLETTHDDPELSPDLRDAAVGQTDAILKTMHQVLSHMVELEDFNEAVQLLRSIIEEQEQLGEAIRERRKAKLRQLLED
jgi:hypothetical protein